MATQSIFNSTVWALETLVPESLSVSIPVRTLATVTAAAVGVFFVGRAAIRFKAKHFDAKMPIFVTSLTGNTNTYYVSKYHTILELKDLICKNTKIPISELRLIFSGKQLEEEYCLADYNIQKKSTIHMNLRLRGD